MSITLCYFDQDICVVTEVHPDPHPQSYLAGEGKEQLPPICHVTEKICFFEQMILPQNGKKWCFVFSLNIELRAEPQTRTLLALY
jgi:hypothetical protein